MNSKEALENIKHAPGFMGGHSRYKSVLESRIPFLEDIEIIKKDLDKLENLEKENQELKNTILSLELDTCVPELRKENAKLKSIIKILKDKIGLFIFESNNIHYVGNEYAVGKITQEQYELLKEILKND